MGRIKVFLVPGRQNDGMIFYISGVKKEPENM
jgi:hypothetical protein